MNLEASVNKLNEPDYFYISIKKDNKLFEGKFERSELRNLIQIIDNAI